jgi:hypothetical protein
MTPLELLELIPTAPFTGAQARAFGCSRWQLAQLVRAGLVRRVLTDVYVRTDVQDSTELRASAAALVLSPHAVLVDRTAAWLWGIDALDPHEVGTAPCLEVFVLRGHKRVQREEARGGERDLLAGEVVSVGGVRVTSPLRTALDLACRLSRYEALATLDAFARQHGLTPAQMTLELARRYRRRRGVVQARELVPLVTPLAESTGESFVRIIVHDEGLPRPRPQVWVYVDGIAVYRIDLAYERLKVCVEYDGEEFHSGDDQRAYDDARRAWLRDQGWWVVVVDKHSFRGPAREAWLAELRRALAERGATSTRGG